VMKVMFKALAKDPAERYQDAGSFAIALERLVHGQALEEIKPTKRKHSSLLRWGAIALVVMTVASVSWFMGSSGQKVKLAILLTENTQNPLSSTLAQSTSPQAIESTSTAETIIFRTSGTPTIPIEMLLPPGQTLDATMNMGFFDDFNDVSYDGSYNQNLWEMRDTCDNVSQESGMFLFNNKYKGDTNCVFVAKSHGNTFFNIEGLSWFEADVFLADDFGYGTATQQITYLTNDIPGNIYWVTCGIIIDAMNVSTFFDIRDYGQRKESEYHIELPAEVNRWYDIRIEIDSDTMKMSCLVDNEILGSHIPIDAELLRVAKFERNFSAARFPYTLGTTAMDNVRISP
jgi:hypothetical protein